MTRLLPAALALMLCGCSPGSYTLPITGTVTADGLPVAGADLDLDAAGNGTGPGPKFQSGPNGTFGIEVPLTDADFVVDKKPAWVLRVSRPGYEAKSVRLNVAGKPAAAGKMPPLIIEVPLQRVATVEPVVPTR